MERDAMLLMRIPTPVKEALRLAAEDDQRSMSDYVLKVMSDRLEASGYLERRGSAQRRKRA
jgi:hypothetical protein